MNSPHFLQDLYCDYNANDENTFSRGWLLLTGANWLIRTNQLAAVEAACYAALPSTVAKSLYLFFDLPALPKTGTDEEVKNAILFL